MGAACFDRDRHDLGARGLYLDMPAWGYHVFDIATINEAPADERLPATSSSNRLPAVQAGTAGGSKHTLP
jgi:hypothetical protein